MIKKHILKTDFEHNYFLIGVKSVLEDYRFAYYFNKKFNLSLKKENFSLHYKEGEFAVFGYENSKTNSYWSIITNKQVIEKTTSNDTFSLFEEISNTYVLIPEEKKVDYFIKIESDFTTTEKQEFIKQVNSIHRVIISSEINPNNLKSKDLLIF